MGRADIPVLSASQATHWDLEARTRWAIPSRTLMEAAGRAVASVVARVFGEELTGGVIVAAGPGNNGGDGWVAARALHAVGIPVRVVSAGPPTASDCVANAELARAHGIPQLEPDGAWPRAAVIIDALLGTGATGPLRGPIAPLAARIAAYGSPVAAVDGPTGLDLTTGTSDGDIRATLTITFGGLRRGHLLARERCGLLVVTDIGFPPHDPGLPRFVTDNWARARLPGFAADMHKGDRGRVLIVGGASGMSGAAIHAAQSAFRAGAGLVKLAATPDTLAAVRTAMPDVMTIESALGPDLESGLLDALQWADSIVAGPGLGRGADRSSFVRALLQAARCPVLLDADALRVPLEWPVEVPALLTPHLGEFQALFPDLASLSGTDRFAAAAEAARRGGATVLLKGVPTIIAAPDGAMLVCGAGNPALATGGSGDVLAGLGGAFLARRLGPLEAGGLAAQTMGRAADLAAARLGVRGVRPGDVVDAAAELMRSWSALVPPALPPVLLELEAPAVS